MGVKDRQLRSTSSWPLGINNLEQEDSIPVDPKTGVDLHLRQAVNVDLTRAGKVQRRDGYTQRLSAKVHSLYEAPFGLLGVVNGDLKCFDANLTATTLVAGVGQRPVSYDTFGTDVCWTNGVQIGRIDENLVPHQVWVDAPGQPTVLPYGVGGMPAATYQVAITYRDSFGRESGSSLATLVDVVEGGGIQLTHIPHSIEASTTRIYVSPPNGDALYWVMDVPTGVSTCVFGLSTEKKLISTQWHQMLPPGQSIRLWNGRGLVAAQNVLWYSDAYRYGLTLPGYYTRYNGYISMLRSVGEADASGVFVAVDSPADGKGRTYFLSGPNPAEWKRTVVYPNSAIEGTDLLVPGSLFGFDSANRVAYWVASNGVPCVGLPTGQVVPLTEGRFVTPFADRGTTLFRDEHGLRQMITSLLGSSTNTAAISDFATASITRNGITLP